MQSKIKKEELAFNALISEMTKHNLRMPRRSVSTKNIKKVVSPQIKQPTPQKQNYCIPENPF